MFMYINESVAIVPSRIGYVFFQKFSNYTITMPKKCFSNYILIFSHPCDSPPAPPIKKKSQNSKRENTELYMLEISVFNGGCGGDPHVQVKMIKMHSISVAKN